MAKPLINRRGYNVPPSVEVIPGLVDIRYLEKLFRKSPATIIMWRASKGMPFVEIPGGRMKLVRYNLRKVLEWAAYWGVRVAAPELTVAGWVESKAKRRKFKDPGS